MQTHPPAADIEAVATAAGTLTYLLGMVPEALPPRRARDPDAAATARLTAATRFDIDDIRHPPDCRLNSGVSA